jgi:DNA-binding CsgD family transcriptional regulator
MGAQRHPKACKPWRNKPVMTPQQIACVNLLIDGYRDVEIARELGCSDRNVNQILTAAMRRTGNKTRAQLAAWWALCKEGFRMKVAA